MEKRVTQVTAKLPCKVQARVEEILQEKNITSSGLIYALYHQIASTGDIPFSTELPLPTALNYAGQDEFNEMLASGYEQAISNKRCDAAIVFNNIYAQVEHEI